MKIQSKIFDLRKVSILVFSAIVGVVAVSVADKMVFAESQNSNVEVAASAENGRMITVYDQDTRTEVSLVTKAKTVEDALKSAKIEVNSGDVVEPSLSTELVAASYSVNIYRARPVVVEDGVTRNVITTAHQTPAQIAKAAGVEIHPEDKAEINRSSDILNDGVGLVMSIQRATEFTFVLYGKEEVVRTNTQTVGEFIREKGIELGDNDQLSVSEDTNISAGMKLELWRNGKQTITEEQEVTPPVEQIRDADREVGFEEVREAGESGKKTVTYEVDMQNGKEVSRKEINSVVTKEPKKRVVVVGTKAKAVGYTGGGNKDTWLAASGIPQEYWGYVDSIVTKESGWNPNATNPSSGACGLAQALPCSKVGGAGGYDPVSSLQWMNSYVNGRYGGWAGAYNFWQANRWY